MGYIITYEGIENVVMDLDYVNPNTLKHKYVHFIKSRYTPETDILSMQRPDPDGLIRMIWDLPEDQEAIRAKRKNLSSIRSAVNSDLKDLFQKGLNPEGITISPDHLFVMSDDAKNERLNAFAHSIHTGTTIDLMQIADVLNLIGEFIEKNDGLSSSTSSDVLENIRHILEMLKTREFDSNPSDENKEPESGQNAPDSSEGDGTGLSDVDKDEFEEVTEEDLEIVDEAGADIVDENDLEEIEEAETDIVDEVELEEVEDTDTDIVDEDELEEVEDTDADIVDEDELDEVEEADADIVDEDELEELDEADADIVDEDELEEVEEEDLENPPSSTATQNQGDLGGSGLPDENLSASISPDEEKRRLADQFTKELSAMDRYYNSYLRIPGGRYLIGSPNPQKHEMAERLVDLNDFFIGKFPIINALFEVFVTKTGYRTTAEKKGYGTVYTGRFKKITDKKTGQIRSVWNATFSYQIVKGACWYQPDGPESTIAHRQNHPVVQVSLEDAFAFASWVGKTLPSETQWEACARTDKGYIYPWGNAWTENACNMEKSAVSETTPVDRYLDFVNPNKIADLLGNVLEWTSDYIPSPFSPQSGVHYVITKGGSWISSHPVSLWSRFIFKYDYTANILGFRCVAL
jgi:formylglycine-generating enzyme required for sulfatase activity